MTLPHTPDLRIIPLTSLVEQEYNDIQRTQPLAERLRIEGILKNPPIVAPIQDGSGRFVILDGANRTTALKLLGYPHVLVQVVDYDDPKVVTLDTWHHVVTHMDLGVLERELRAVPGLEVLTVDLLAARAGLARREDLAYIVLTDGRVFAARTVLPRRSVHERNQVLNALVNTYKERCRLQRTTSDHVEDARRTYTDFTALVVFPNYETAEVMMLAREGELLPPGLTRHVIQGRVLRMNYPLNTLRSHDPLELKNAELQVWIKRKFDTREVRFYGEGTFLFDE